jgi:hypothetical protein
VELEKTDTGEKMRAEVETVDYEANLALLKAIDDDFLKGMTPLILTTEARAGDQLEVWQVKPNGDITPSRGPITSIELIRYPHANYFLAYRMNGSLQYRFKNFTLPVVRGGKLAGLLMRYHAKSQTIDVVAAPIIEHFIKDAAEGPYNGFPIAGMKIVQTEDPQLRRYVGISGEMGGVLVEGVVKGSPAEKAGIKMGDIIIEMAGFPVDSKGNYRHPLYGKISISHMIRCQFHVGHIMSLKFLRSREIQHFEMVLDRRIAEDYLVPPYLFDRAPRYYILGGLVLQELSFPYLMEYGSRWRSRAPIRLVYYADHQHSLEAGEKDKIVFISSVLPTSYTIGYDSLSTLVLARINHQIIQRLEDVPKALETPINGFHKIEFDEHPNVIYLDPQEIPEINRQIRRRYNLPSLKNLDIRKGSASPQR